LDFYKDNIIFLHADYYPSGCSSVVLNGKDARMAGSTNGRFVEDLVSALGTVRSQP
jgi:hypothetical protein